MVKTLTFCPFCEFEMLTEIIEKPYATLYHCSNCNQYFFVTDLKSGAKVRIKVKQAIFVVEVGEPRKPKQQLGVPA
jgi:uncharacterized Zn finger protein